MIGENEEYDEAQTDRDTKSVVHTFLFFAGLIVGGCILLIYWLW